MLNHPAAVNIAGLVLGALGVIIIFVWGPPQPSFEENTVVVATPDDATVKAARALRNRHQCMSRVGLALVLAGFVLQLVAALMWGSAAAGPPASGAVPSTSPPTWYIAIALIWSACQGFRGAVEQHVNSHIRRPDKDWCYADELKKPWQRWVVLYLHDFAFRFACTAAGFVALFAAHDVSRTPLKDLSSGALTFAGLAFLVGVIGVGGQLHTLILLGKVGIPK